MQRHVLRVHLKCKTKCEFCEKEFPPDALPKHIKTAHQGNRIDKTRTAKSNSSDVV